MRRIVRPMSDSELQHWQTLLRRRLREDRGGKHRPPPPPGLHDPGIGALKAPLTDRGKVHAGLTPLRPIPCAQSFAPHRLIRPPASRCPHFEESRSAILSSGWGTGFAGDAFERRARPSDLLSAAARGLPAFTKQRHRRPAPSLRYRPDACDGSCDRCRRLRTFRISITNAIVAKSKGTRTGGLYGERFSPGSQRAASFGNDSGRR